MELLHKTYAVQVDGPPLAPEAQRLLNDRPEYIVLRDELNQLRATMDELEVDARHYAQPQWDSTLSFCAGHGPAVSADNLAKHRESATGKSLMHVCDVALQLHHANDRPKNLRSGDSAPASNLVRAGWDQEAATPTELFDSLSDQEASIHPCCRHLLLAHYAAVKKRLAEMQAELENAVLPLAAAITELVSRSTGHVSTWRNICFAFFGNDKRRRDHDFQARVLAKVNADRSGADIVYAVRGDVVEGMSANLVGGAAMLIGTARSLCAAGHRVVTLKENDPAFDPMPSEEEVKLALEVVVRKIVSELNVEATVKGRNGHAYRTLLSLRVSTLHDTSVNTVLCCAYNFLWLHRVPQAQRDGCVMIEVLPFSHSRLHMHTRHQVPSAPCGGTRVTATPQHMSPPCGECSSTQSPTRSVQVTTQQLRGLRVRSPSCTTRWSRLRRE